LVGLEAKLRETADVLSAWRSTVVRNAESAVN
jgi:hypothetical protein